MLPSTEHFACVSYRQDTSLPLSATGLFHTCVQKHSGAQAQRGSNLPRQTGREVAKRLKEDALHKTLFFIQLKVFNLLRNFSNLYTNVLSS